MPKEGTPQTHEAKIVCLCPDVCLTPVGSGQAPVCYQILAYFDAADNVHDKVRFTGIPAFSIQSFIKGVKGNEAGTGRGVMSGVHASGGFSHAQSFSGTVRIKKNNIVRDGDLMVMNGNSPNGPGNTIGRVLYCRCTTMVRLDANGNIIGETDPPFKPEDLEIENYLKRKWDAAKKAAEEARERLDPDPMNWNPLEQFKKQVGADMTAFMQENRVLDRGMGLLGLIGAGFEGAGGIVAIGAGVTTVNPVVVGGGGVLFTHALDSGMANYIQMTTGEATATVTQQFATDQALQAGYSPEASGWMGWSLDTLLGFLNPAGWGRGLKAPPTGVPRAPVPDSMPRPIEVPPKSGLPHEAPKATSPPEAPKNPSTPEPVKEPVPGEGGGHETGGRGETNKPHEDGQTGKSQSEDTSSKASNEDKGGKSKDQSGSEKGKKGSGKKSSGKSGKDGAKVTRKRKASSPRLPDAKKWIKKKGGRVIYNPDGSTTYITKDGVSVTYGPDGYPDFSPHAVKQVPISPMTGDASDFTRANEAAGFASKPRGFTWHHVEDGKTMQLIPQKIHDAFPHTGGASLARNPG